MKAADILAQNYPPSQVGEPPWELAERLFPRQGEWTMEEFLALENRGIKYSDGCLEFPGANGFDHRESVTPRHLDVEKNHVGGPVPDDLNGRVAVARLSQFGVHGRAAHEVREALPRQRFVIHNQHAPYHACHACIMAGKWWGLGQSRDWM